MMRNFSRSYINSVIEKAKSSSPDEALLFTIAQKLLEGNYPPATVHSFLKAGYLPLVNKTFYNNPRRTTTGISINRLHQILAVIEKHIGIKLSQYDCYVATGGGFEINDPSSDLGVAISIL